MTRKQGLRLVIVIILALLAGSVFLSVLSARDMTKIIKEDFNSQQLELARHAAGILTENFKILKRELLTLSLSPSIQYIQAVSWSNRMKISFSTIREYGVTRITLINASGTKAYTTNYTDAVFEDNVSYGNEDFFLWCKDPENKGDVYISDIKKRVEENSETGFIALLAVPVRQVSIDEAHPEATQMFSGVLVFALDVGLFTQRVVGPIRSGKTGYAWVIDESGNFLYHKERDFIGHNAFEVRSFKDPHISFTKINLIQKDKMLQGEEGTSWYISGWHRGLMGKVEKLIAYSPVHIVGANTKRIWSVAVVAPISEVEDAINSVSQRQSLMQGAFILAAVIVLSLFIGVERAWLRTLEQVVQEKTRDLGEYAERLRRSEESYRTLIDSADDLIYTVDQEGKILSVNQYYKRITGKDPKDIIGGNIMEIIRHRDQDVLRRIIKRVTMTSQTFSHEAQARIGDKEYWLDTKYKPILTGSGEIDSVLVISRDITEHKRIETQLFHTEKLASLGSLSAGVAHEINNPIAIILGFTEMLLERFPQDSKEHNILKTIERQGNNCKRIVENLLAFARIPQKSTLETDVVEDLSKVINVLRNTLITKKVELKADMNQHIPRVRGDGQQLEQVFMNIINNAVAAMDEGGLLTITVRHSNGTVAVDFTDTGHGIPAENMEKIFEPFFTTKKVGEGTGLGLSVSYGIVKKFGGDIQVQSRVAGDGKDSGTTFTILLAVTGSEDSKTKV